MVSCNFSEPFLRLGCASTRRLREPAEAKEPGLGSSRGRGVLPANRGTTRSGGRPLRFLCCPVGVTMATALGRVRLARSSGAARTEGPETWERGSQTLGRCQRHVFSSRPSHLASTLPRTITCSKLWSSPNCRINPEAVGSELCGEAGISAPQSSSSPRGSPSCRVGPLGTGASHSQEGRQRALCAQTRTHGTGRKAGSTGRRARAGKTL